MGISAADFEYVSEFARRTAAIVLEPGKEYLVETRLAPLARDYSRGSLDAFVEQLRNEPAASVLRARALDALTTNETSFFRDFHPFEGLRKAFIPELIAARGATRTLSIWSAACSAGQEPVSLAILLRHHFPELAGWTLRLLATDISGAVLDMARAASYSQFEVNRGLPAPLLLKYFKKDGDRWVVNEAIRAMIDYQPRNLIEPWPDGEQHDIVMLRNVLIYFDVPSKRRILGEVKRRLAPRGLLFLGASETTLNIDADWEIVREDKTTAFRLRAGAAAA